MRRHASALVVMAAALLGCGGAATTGSLESGGLGTARGADDGCDRGSTRIGGACWSAVGTRWSVTAEASAGVDDFELELLAAGRVRSNDHGAASPATDEWFLEGGVLRVFLSDRFVEYRATVTNGTMLVGEAINVRGQRWPWRAGRVFGERPCGEGEARLEGACMSVAGTRWQLAGEHHVIELLADGVLASSGGEPGQDRWTQDGARVRFTIDEGVRRFEGTLESDGVLAGTQQGEAGTGTFRASRLESIPPAR